MQNSKDNSTKVCTKPNKCQNFGSDVFFLFKLTKGILEMIIVYLNKNKFCFTLTSNVLTVTVSWQSNNSEQTHVLSMLLF